MMKIHIGILTSSDAPKAVRCMRSAIMQRTFFSDTDVSIIVNSTKGYYAKEVIDLVRREEEFITVVETPSNGKPGKGKNEAIKYLKTQEADYYMLLDGDDFLYPSALALLMPLMVEGYDLISGQASDHWENSILKKTWYNEQPNNAITYNRDIIKGRDYDLWYTFSIDRIYCMSREFIMHHIPEMEEDIDLYEDFIFTARVTKMQELKKIKYCMVNSSNIYGYDRSGESQCSIFTTDKKLAEWNMDKFWEYISMTAYPIKFSEVPFRKLQYPENFGIKEKQTYYNLIDSNEANIRTQ